MFPRLALLPLALDVVVTFAWTAPLETCWECDGVDLDLTSRDLGELDFAAASEPLDPTAWSALASAEEGEDKAPLIPCEELTTPETPDGPTESGPSGGETWLTATSWPVAEVAWPGEAPVVAWSVEVAVDAWSVEAAVEAWFAEAPVEGAVLWGGRSARVGGEARLSWGDAGDI